MGILGIIVSLLFFLVVFVFLFRCFRVIFEPPFIFSLPPIPNCFLKKSRVLSTPFSNRPYNVSSSFSSPFFSSCSLFSSSSSSSKSFSNCLSFSSLYSLSFSIFFNSRCNSFSCSSRKASFSFCISLFFSISWFFSFNSAISSWISE